MRKWRIRLPLPFQGIGKSRLNYWCHSKLAQKIKKGAGIESPDFLPWEEWDDYYADWLKKSPLTYILVEVLFPLAQDICCYPADFSHCCWAYYSNRFITKVHVLQTGLPKGCWYDTDFRIVFGMFETLKQYVDGELGHMYLISDNRDLCVPKEQYGLQWLKDAAVEEFDCSYFDWSNPLTEKEKEFIEADRKCFEERRDAYRKTLEIYQWWETHKIKKLDGSENEEHHKEEDKYLHMMIDLRGFYWT